VQILPRITPATGIATSIHEQSVLSRDERRSLAVPLALRQVRQREAEEDARLAEHKQQLVGSSLEERNSSLPVVRRPHARPARIVEQRHPEQPIHSRAANSLLEHGPLWADHRTQRQIRSAADHNAPLSDHLEWAPPDLPLAAGLHTRRTKRAVAVTTEAAPTITTTISDVDFDLRFAVICKRRSFS
jgi:hypothetical protein